MIHTIIVDDEILSRVGIQSFLQDKDWVTVDSVFGTAQDALDYLATNPVDVVITDIEMADMNGLEFIKVLRSRDLVAGIIIISCHDDFEYAREAITLGTDNYLLKHDLDEKKLLQAIELVYQKNADKRATPMHNRLRQTPEFLAEDGVYMIGILKMLNSDTGQPQTGTRVDESMLINLLEGIVDNYSMGTLYAPYMKDIFIVFRFDPQLSDEERNLAINEYVNIILDNLAQYINSQMVIGVSNSFENPQDIHRYYAQAAASVEQTFYGSGERIFCSQQMLPQQGAPEKSFTSINLLEGNGIMDFEKELVSYLEECGSKNVLVSQVKGTLSQGISELFYRVLDEYSVHKDSTKKWSARFQIIPAITAAESAGELRVKLVEIFTELKKEIQQDIKQDELREVFQYIEENIKEHISLAEVAGIKCMSIPAFCKKFKERTGMTLVQYINKRRIERAKVYLNESGYSLQQIADMVGFSNENYLVRVFKQVTGKTITDYRSGHSR